MKFDELDAWIEGLFTEDENLTVQYVYPDGRSETLRAVEFSCPSCQSEQSGVETSFVNIRCLKCGNDFPR